MTIKPVACRSCPTEEENMRLREALEKLSLCEDDSSWGDWVRNIAGTALGGGE